MNRTALTLFLIAAFFLLFTTIVTAETRILNQKISNCENGMEISETVKQGEKVQAKITVLIAEEQELVLYTHLQNPSFYLGEQKLSENSSLILTLGPGTHILRVIGVVPLGEVIDNQEITLLGSDAISCYLTTSITTPYILKNTAYTYTLVFGASSAAFAALVVFLATRKKMNRVKTGAGKRTEERREKIRGIVKSYLEVVAPSLNMVQKKQAKALMKELDGLLKWR